MCIYIYICVCVCVSVCLSRSLSLSLSAPAPQARVDVLLIIEKYDLITECFAFVLIFALGLLIAAINCLIKCALLR